MSLLSDLFSKRNTSTPAPIVDLFAAPAPTILAKPKKQKLQASNVQKILGEQPREQQQPEDEKRHQETEEQKQEKLSRTVYVGNVNIEAKRNALQKMFSEFGVVEKIWFRSVPVENNKMGPKASFILKKFRENAESMNAYIRFKTREQAQAAVKLHNTKFMDLTIRVTLADEKVIDNETTVFVGNLPFDVKDEEFRTFCEKFGKVNDVRVVRNSHTHEGIGIAYVKYSTKEEMKIAISQMACTQFKGRKLRAKKSVDKKRLEKKMKKIQSKKQQKAQDHRTAAAQRIQNKLNAEKNITQKQPTAKESPQQPKQPLNKVEQKKQFNNMIKQQNVNKNKQQKVEKTERTKKKEQKQDAEEEQLRKEVQEQLKMLKTKGISKD